MKAIILFLLFAIISLSEAARPNLRFLRSIPNRTQRDVKRIDDTKPIIIINNFPKIILKIINTFFQSDDEARELLSFYIKNPSEKNLETACRYCSTTADFSYTDCKNYVNFLVEYLISNNMIYLIKE